MKKLIIFTTGFIIHSFPSFAQTNSFPDDGNVGIGTAVPDAPLHVRKASDAYIKVQSDGGSYSYMHLTGGASNGYLIKNLTGSTSNGALAGALYTYVEAGYDFQHIQDGIARFTIKNGGDVGIGTATPEAPLHIHKTTDANIKVQSDGGSYSYMHLTDGTSNGYLIKNLTGSTGNGASAGALYTYVEEGYDFQHIQGGVPRFTIKDGGNIGIGTTTPDSKLTVAGNIHSQEVKVSVAAGADFVFGDSYQLEKLEKLERFIIENKHLPEIASAEDMKKNGIELGEMNIKLLQKIEELTLHLIEQNKKQERLLNKVNKLQKEVNHLKSKP